MNTRIKKIVESNVEPSKEDIWYDAENNTLLFYTIEGWLPIGKAPIRNTKAICDTVYTLKKVKKGMSYVYNRTGEFTVENCVLVDSRCTITYKSIVNKANLTETIKAEYSCPVIRNLTSEEFIQLGGEIPEIPMGETITTI